MKKSIYLAIGLTTAFYALAPAIAKPGQEFTYPFTLANDHVFDMYWRSNGDLTQEQIIRVIQCRKGKYSFDAKALTNQYAGLFGERLPQGIIDAMRAANAASNGISVPPNITCPEFRTRLSSTNPEYGYANKMAFP
jgi:hypothetical protein